MAVSVSHKSLIGVGRKYGALLAQWLQPTGCVNAKSYQIMFKLTLIIIEMIFYISKLNQMLFLFLTCN